VKTKETNLFWRMDFNFFERLLKMTEINRDISHKTFGDDFMHEKIWYRAFDSDKHQTGVYAMKIAYKGAAVESDKIYLFKNKLEN
jgi:hypothetical protein